MEVFTMYSIEQDADWVEGMMARTEMKATYADGAGFKP